MLCHVHRHLKEHLGEQDPGADQEVVAAGAKTPTEYAEVSLEDLASLSERSTYMAMKIARTENVIADAIGNGLRVQKKMAAASKASEGTMVSSRRGGTFVQCARLTNVHEHAPEQGDLDHKPRKQPQEDKIDRCEDKRRSRHGRNELGRLPGTPNIGAERVSRLRRESHRLRSRSRRVRYVRLTC